MSTYQKVRLLGQQLAILVLYSSNWLLRLAGADPGLQPVSTSSADLPTLEQQYDIISYKIVNSKISLK